MSNLGNEEQFESITEVLRFIFEQRFKGIYTALPGVIKSYNQTTKRAAVQPALTRILTDGTESPYPIVQNVPVCFPTGGGFSILFPVAAGDTCLMIFSQRGIENFKETFQQERPDEGLLDLNDAVAIMGFGPLTVTPASATGASLQIDDGTDAVIIEPGKVTVTSSGDVIVNATNVTVNAGNTQVNGNLKVTGDLAANNYTSLSGTGSATMTGGLDIIGGTVEHDNINIGKDHVHSGVASGGSNTGGPQ